jgi:hypothetical protein
VRVEQVVLQPRPPTRPQQHQHRSRLLHGFWERLVLQEWRCCRRLVESGSSLDAEWIPVTIHLIVCARGLNCSGRAPWVIALDDVTTCVQAACQMCECVCVSVSVCVCVCGRVLPKQSKVEWAAAPRLRCSALL